MEKCALRAALLQKGHFGKAGLYPLIGKAGIQKHVHAGTGGNVVIPGVHAVQGGSGTLWTAAPQTSDGLRRQF